MLQPEPCRDGRTRPVKCVVHRRQHTQRPKSRYTQLAQHIDTQLAQHNVSLLAIGMLTSDLECDDSPGTQYLDGAGGGSGGGDVLGTEPDCKHKAMIVNLTEDSEDTEEGKSNPSVCAVIVSPCSWSLPTSCQQPGS